MLFGNRFYRSIKLEGCISEATRHLLLNTKKLINSPSNMLDKEFIGLNFTSAFLLLRQTFEAKGKYVSNIVNGQSLLNIYGAIINHNPRL